MSRFEPGDYEPDGPAITYEMWEYNLNRTIAGGKGQALLRTLRDALEALPSKRLIEGRLAKDGDVCAVGAFRAYQIARDNGVNMEAAIARTEEIEVAQCKQHDPHWTGEPDDYSYYDEWPGRMVTIEQGVAAGLNKTLAYAIGQLNDEDLEFATPEVRWLKVMDYLNATIKEAVPA